MDDKLEKLEGNSETSTEIASTWTSGHEQLLASIADRANCYRWLHEKSQIVFDRYNFYLTVPSIILSTLTGSATIGLTSLFPPEDQKIAGVIIGILTLSCGVLTSVNQYMKTSQTSESNRVAAVAYGKLHRVISCELALRRDQRVNASDFLKVVRSEQDRLQETSPNILEPIINRFRKEFNGESDLERPEIVGDLDHVRVNVSHKNEDLSEAFKMTIRRSSLIVPVLEGKGEEDLSGAHDRAI